MYNEIYHKVIGEICVHCFVDKKLHFISAVTLLRQCRRVFLLKNQILHIAQSAINVLYINIILLSYTSACYAMIKIFPFSRGKRYRECED